jgi:hypothetical protein
VQRIKHQLSYLLSRHWLAPVGKGCKGLGRRYPAMPKQGAAMLTRFLGEFRTDTLAYIRVACRAADYDLRSEPPRSISAYSIASSIPE